MLPKGPKDSVATAAGTNATQNPTIAKSPRFRPDASAAVAEATACLAAARAAASAAFPRESSAPLTSGRSHVPSNQSSRQSITPEASEMELLQVKIASIESRNEAILSVLEEVKERFEVLENKIAATPTLSEPKKVANGMIPVQVTKAYIPWVDATTLASVVSLNLDMAHFIKLMPIKERPKGQTNIGLTSGVHFDAETGRASIINESNVQYEKQFPDLATLINALTVYATIRDIYDADKLGFSVAFTLYIRQLTNWTKHHNWSSIVSYFVSHFDKYQSSSDPRVWIDVDLQLFAQHMTNDTITPSTKPKFSSKTSSICKNWNTKGCVWKTCTNLHICQYCSRADHTGLHCPQKTKSS